jgi:antitoxin (DNA-binding transcriptional repressor) of toxin-antitoxin stability system
MLEVTTIDEGGALMNFYTVRDLRTQPKQIWEKLSEVHELIITNNGKPSALMIEIDDENMEDVLRSVRQSMAMRATNKLRLASMMNGNAKMTDLVIEAEIAEMRKERKG